MSNRTINILPHNYPSRLVDHMVAEKYYADPHFKTLSSLREKIDYMCSLGNEPFLGEYKNIFDESKAQPFAPLADIPEDRVALHDFMHYRFNFSHSISGEYDLLVAGSILKNISAGTEMNRQILKDLFDTAHLINMSAFVRDNGQGDNSYIKSGVNVKELFDSQRIHLDATTSLTTPENLNATKLIAETLYVNYALQKPFTDISIKNLMAGKADKVQTHLASQSAENILSLPDKYHEIDAVQIELKNNFSNLIQSKDDKFYLNEKRATELAQTLQESPQATIISLNCVVSALNKMNVRTL